MFLEKCRRKVSDGEYRHLIFLQKALILIILKKVKSHNPNVHCLY